MLEYLVLDNTDVVDLQPLRELRCLTFLSAAGTDVLDIADVPESLEQLSLSQTKVSDIARVRSLTSLRRINLDYAPVRDLRPLSDVPTLKYVSLLQAQAGIPEDLELRGVEVNYRSWPAW
ncbi:hypothetical protein ADK75_36350 [Streptomyces virginiae]|uniref:Leucine-rich repeat domain-containing protein n=2 Tax=Streptomyces TaxID=1883 RepID=A0A0L8M1P6_STRVG|nr:hypothetical protein ADK75_36350 [Streptomyces virginiae]